MTRQKSLDSVLMIGLLALIGLAGIPGLLRFPENSERRDALRELTLLRSRWQRYRNDVGRWPPYYGGDFSLDLPALAFSSLWQNLHGLPGWKGPYLPHSAAPAGSPEERSAVEVDLFTDPWGTFYRVHYIGRGREMGRDGGVVLSSAGPDGEFQASREQLAAGTAAGDDVILVVSRHLDLLW